MAKYRSDGIPVLSITEIEREIEHLRTAPTHTEKWMSKRALAKATELEAKDRKLRAAFEAGYRMGGDITSLAPIVGVGIVMSALGLIMVIRDYILPLI